MGVIRSGGVNCHVAIGGVEGSGRYGRGLRQTAWHGSIRSLTIGAKVDRR